MLVNAVYFKGNWLRKFDSALTKVEPFFLGSKDNKMDAKMMHIEADFRSGYVNELKARVVELPYVVIIIKTIKKVLLLNILIFCTSRVEN